VAVPDQATGWQCIGGPIKHRHLYSRLARLFTYGSEYALIIASVQITSSPSIIEPKNIQVLL